MFTCISRYTLLDRHGCLLICICWKRDPEPSSLNNWALKVGRRAHRQQYLSRSDDTVANNQYQCIQNEYVYVHVPWVLPTPQGLTQSQTFSRLDWRASLKPVAGLNLLQEKVSWFSELSSQFEFWRSFSSDVKVNPVFSWKGQNYFQRIFPPYSQHFTTPQISFEFSGFYSHFKQLFYKTNQHKRLENLLFSRNLVWAERKRPGQCGVMWTEDH